MQLFVSSILRSKISNKWIFLDNDFLTSLFKEKELFKLAISDILSSGHLMIDPLTKFEFLRDIFIPKERDASEEFVEQPVFVPVANHQQIFSKIQENALLLSKIYSHKGVPKKKCSAVDLFLAGRLMLNPGSSVLITGNKKDFPICVFDVVGVINFEQEGDGSMRAYTVVEFSREKFEKSFDELNKVEEK